MTAHSVPELPLDEDEEVLPLDEPLDEDEDVLPLDEDVLPLDEPLEPLDEDEVPDEPLEPPWPDELLETLSSSATSSASEMVSPQPMATTETPIKARVSHVLSSRFMVA